MVVQSAGGDRVVGAALGHLGEDGALAVVEVVEWAAGAGCTRLWATVRDWNTASLRVLEKLGFHDTGDREPDDGHGASLIAVRPL